MTVKPVATADPGFVPRTPSKLVSRPNDVHNSSPTSIRPENSSPSRDPKRTSSLSNFDVITLPSCAALVMASMGIRKEPSGLTRVNSRRDSDCNANKAAGLDNYTPMLSNMSPKPPASAVRPSPADGGPPRFPLPDIEYFFFSPRHSGR